MCVNILTLCKQQRMGRLKQTRTHTYLSPLPVRLSAVTCTFLVSFSSSESSPSLLAASNRVCASDEVPLLRTVCYVQAFSLRIAAVSPRKKASFSVGATKVKDVEAFVPQPHPSNAWNFFWNLRFRTTPTIEQPQLRTTLALLPLTLRSSTHPNESIYRGPPRATGVYRFL